MLALSLIGPSATLKNLSSLSFYILKKFHLCYSLKLFSIFIFTFKHFMVNKSRTVAVISNQIQDLKSSIRFFFCPWKLNGLAAHNFSKVFLSQAVSVSKSFDLICLFETFLDRSVDSSDEWITIEGYNLLRSTKNPSKKKEESLHLL